MISARDREIDRNYTFFAKYVQQLLPRHLGEFVLLRNAQLVETFPSVGQAIAAGHKKFDDGVFSIQEVTDRPLDLGFFSHANFEGGVRTEAANN